MDALVTPQELQDRLGDPGLRVVDTRWYLDPAKRGIDAYAAGHVPGALFLAVDQDLAAPGGARGSVRGRHPWPPPAQVAEVMGRAGIGPGVRVVAYDDACGSVAARLWFLLRAHGHDDVAVLDGGFPRWVAEGRPVDCAVPVIAPRTFTPVFRPELLAEADELLGAPLVLDARAGERYRGETERRGREDKSAADAFSLSRTPPPGEARWPDQVCSEPVLRFRSR